MKTTLLVAGLAVCAGAVASAAPRAAGQQATAASARATLDAYCVASRRVQIVGSTPHPHDVFMQQVVRTLTAADDGLLAQHRVLICDRDTKWSAPVRARLRDAGVHVVLTPYRAPNANAYAERFVRSIKQECLNRVIPFGDHHLRRTIAEYVEHYHREQNHQRIENELIERLAGEGNVGRIRRRPRLGGLLNYYCRAA